MFVRTDQRGWRAAEAVDGPGSLGPDSKQRVNEHGKCWSRAPPPGMASKLASRGGDGLRWCSRRTEDLFSIHT